MGRKAQEMEEEARRLWAHAQQVRNAGNVARLIDLFADYLESRARTLRDEAKSRGEAVMD